MNHSALLVIDFINDIVHPDGKISRCAKMVNENKTIEKANTVIQFANKKNWIIIFVKVAFSENYFEVPKESKFFGGARNLGALQINTWGTEFIEGLSIPKNHITIVKNRVNVFHQTNLDLILKANNISELYLTGVSTEMAIQSTARDACDRDYKVTVIADACAGGSPEGYQSSIEVLKSISNVISTEELI